MFDALLSVFFPEHCHGCGKAGTALCLDCYKKIPAATSTTLPANAVALLDYQHPLVQKAIWELKYYRKSALAKKLIEYSMSRIPRLIASLSIETLYPIVLVAIPQHSSKTNTRGFNQSQLLARWIAKGAAAALPSATLQPLLRKTRSTEAQAHTHTRQERQKNLQYSMEATGSLDSDTLYIVIDDVITTGSTINEANRALRAAGAKHIYAISLAHGYAHRSSKNNTSQ